MTFDPERATRAYIDSLGRDELAMAQAYTTGNHWLLLWGLVASAIVTWLIVRSGVLDRLHVRLARRSWALRAFLIAAVFLVVESVLLVPWTIYAGWYREGQYDRTSQPLTDFLMQDAMGTIITALLGGLLVLGIYALIRKTGRWWWLWSGGLVAGGLSLFLLISPVVIDPLFNDYQPVPEGEVRTALLEMADEAGIAHDRIFLYDGSRQSNNFTANVGGLGPNARIAISDVALKDASLDEVKAVTGHEIGHYVLGHIWRIVGVLSVLSVAGFWLTARLYPWFARRFGSRHKIDDIRGLPVLSFVFGLLSVLATPIDNAMTRISETEADAYSLTHVGLPDALSGALIKTAEYRYPSPGPVEEALFYTHPSVENRIRTAMEWKASHFVPSPLAEDQ